MKPNRAFLFALGLLIATPGGIFTALMWRSGARAIAMDEWIPTPCFIEKSSVVSRTHNRIAPEFTAKLAYRYEFNNRSHTSTQFELRGQKWSKKPQKFQKIVAQYPTGTQQTCFINPENPKQAVLKKDSKAPLYSIWFPLLFVIGGIGIPLSPNFRKQQQKPTQP